MKSTKKIPAIYKILASKSDEEILTRYNEVQTNYSKAPNGLKDEIARELLPLRREVSIRNLMEV
jgi:hypothetical protein